MRTYNDIYPEIPVFDVKSESSQAELNSALQLYISKYTKESYTIPLLIAKTSLYLTGFPERKSMLELFGVAVEKIDHQTAQLSGLLSRRTNEWEGFTGIYARIYFNTYLSLPRICTRHNDVEIELDFTTGILFEGFIGLKYIYTELRDLYLDKVPEVLTCVNPDSVMNILGTELFAQSEHDTQPAFTSLLTPYISEVLYTEPYVRSFIKISSNESNPAFNALRFSQYVRHLHPQTNHYMNHLDILNLRLAFRCACLYIDHKLTSIGGIIHDFYVKAYNSIMLPETGEIIFQYELLDTMFDLSSIEDRDAYLKAFDLLNNSNKLGCMNVDNELPFIYL